MVFAGGCGFGLLPGLELRLDLLGVLVHVFLSAELSDLAERWSVSARTSSWVISSASLRSTGMGLPYITFVLPFDGMT